VRERHLEAFLENEPPRSIQDGIVSYAQLLRFPAIRARCLVPAKLDCNLQGRLQRAYSVKHRQRPKLSPAREKPAPQIASQNMAEGLAER
jgi:hypothetical protein